MCWILRHQHGMMKRTLALKSERPEFNMCPTNCRLLEKVINPCRVLDGLSVVIILNSLSFGKD